jgi:hypothetical protein
VVAAVSYPPSSGQGRARARLRDPKADTYHCNLSTKPLSVGTWRIKISIDDGTIYRTNISLR